MMIKTTTATTTPAITSPSLPTTQDTVVFYLLIRLPFVYLFHRFVPT